MFIRRALRFVGCGPTGKANWLAPAARARRHTAATAVVALSIITTGAVVSAPVVAAAVTPMPPVPVSSSLDFVYSGGSDPAVSADGRFVALPTAEPCRVYCAVVPQPSWLPVAQQRGFIDSVVVVDRLLGTRQIVATAPGPSCSWAPSCEAGHAFTPVISADGRVVYYQRPGNGLVCAIAAGWGPQCLPIGLNLYRQDISDDGELLLYLGVGGITVHHLHSGVDEIVAPWPASGSSYAPVLSGDGRWVLLSTTANLDGSPGDTGDDYDLFALDRTLGATASWVRLTTGAYTSEPLRLSSDGRYVAFSVSCGVVCGSLARGAYRLDRSTNTLQRVFDSLVIDMSSDGALVSGYDPERLAGQINYTSLIWDASTNQTTKVPGLFTHGGGGAGLVIARNGKSAFAYRDEPQLDGAGTFVPPTLDTADLAGGTSSAYFGTGPAIIYGAGAPAFGATAPPQQGDPKGSTHVSDPVSTATGSFTHSEVDLTALPGGTHLESVRWYNSIDPRVGALGVGWSSPYSDRLTGDGSGNVTFAEATGQTTMFSANLGGGFSHPIGVDAALTMNADRSYALSWPLTGSVWTFDANGRLARKEFSDGQSVMITRDTNGNVATVMSSAGVILTFQYSVVTGAQGLRVSSISTTVSGSPTESTTFGYDTAGNLHTATRGTNATTTYTTDPAGLVVSVTDPAGVSTVINAYDQFRRVASQTNAAGAVTTFSYDPAHLATTVHDPVTNTNLTYTHDVQGRVIAIADPYGHATAVTWDGQSNPITSIARDGTQLTNTFDVNSNLLTSTDPAAGTTTYTYDTVNRVLTTKDPAGNTTTYAYAGTDRVPTTVTDPFGKVTTYVIALGLVQSVTDADGVKTSYTYNAARQVLTVTDGLGNVTTNLYDTAGRATKVTLPSGKFSTTTYDTAGRVLSSNAEDGGITSYTYDPAGRVLTTTDPTLAKTTNTYDTAGRLATTTDPAGAVTNYTYDGNDQLAITTLPGGATTQTTYGPLGRITTATDETGKTTSYTYTATGATATTTAPDGGVTTTGYDTQGRIQTEQDPAGRITTTTYDGAGRVASQLAPGSLTTSYTYDQLGRAKTVTDPRGGITTTTYTPGGRVASVQTPDLLTTANGYDLAGRLKTVTAPGNRVTTYGHDFDGNRTSVRDPAGLTTAMTFDAARRVLTVTDPVGVVTTNTWSLRGELLTTKTGAQGTVFNVYNPDGTLANVTDAVGNKTSFGYDLRKNRTSRTNALNGIDAWTYDPAGNVLTSTDPLNRQTVNTYDAAGRLATMIDPTGRKTTSTYNTDGTVATMAVLNGPTYTYTYDTAGRVATVKDATANTWSYGYETGGQLTSYTTPGGRVTNWAYDTAGRRTRIAYPDGATYNYTYDTAGRLATITPGELLADTFTGTANAAPDTAKWTVTATSGGTGKIVGNELELGYTTTAGSTISIAPPALTLADADLVMRYRFTTTAAANAGLLRVYLRQITGTSGGNYRVEINSSTATATLFRTKGTTTTSLGTFTVPVTTTAQRVRFQVKGTQVSVRVWADGTTEPTAWAKSVVDTQVAAAGNERLEVTRSAGTAKVYVDNLTLTNPTTAPAAVAGYTYNADNQPTVETLTGGSRTRTYTNGRLTGFNETLPGLTRATTIGYDTSGRIATDTTGTLTTSYGYDPAGQLTTITPSTGSATTYTYDNLGRRATSKLGTTATIAYTYDAASQLTNQGTTSYTYDTAGRRLTETATGNTLTYTYNPTGQLATLKRVQGTTTTTQTRTYDPAGLLTAVANVAGNTTTLDWDPTQQVPRLLDVAGAAATDLVGGDLWGSSRSGPSSAAIGTDVYGSVLTGGLARSSAYGAFGEPATASTFEPRLGFRGEVTLDSLTYLRNRDLQPGTGQFTSRDPIDGQNGTTTVANAYHYADSSPLMRADPTGLFAVPDRKVDRRTPTPPRPTPRPPTAPPVPDSESSCAAQGGCGGNGGEDWVAEAIRHYRAEFSRLLHPKVWGKCVSGSVDLLDFTGGLQGCALDNGHEIHVAGSAGTGAGTVGLGAVAGPLTSDAQKVQDLAAWSVCVGIGGGEGVIVSLEVCLNIKQGIVPAKPTLTNPTGGVSLDDLSGVMSVVIGVGFGANGLPFASGHVTTSYTWTRKLFGYPRFFPDLIPKPSVSLI